jgi:hypothetical protein
LPGTSPGSADFRSGTRRAGGLSLEGRPVRAGRTCPSRPSTSHSGRPAVRT